jgi:hypothetical protein
MARAFQATDLLARRALATGGSNSSGIASRFVLALETPLVNSGCDHKNGQIMFMYSFLAAKMRRSV